MSSFSLEIGLWEAGYRFIAGVDEVGRGPIAGPVMTSAVIFPFLASGTAQSDLAETLNEVNDSKALTSAKRLRCLKTIRKTAVAISISMISAQEIDSMGIGKAIRRSMALSILKLPIKPDYILIDGNMALLPKDYLFAANRIKKKLPEFSDKEGLSYTHLNSKTIIKGDALSLSISAASIVAKVTRDRLMSLYSIKYPGYGFDKHKGYGTAEHLRRLSVLGASPIHRLSFSPLTNREFELVDM